jgi:hypothetical protein
MWLAEQALVELKNTHQNVTENTVKKTYKKPFAASHCKRLLSADFSAPRPA